MKIAIAFFLIGFVSGCIYGALKFIVFAFKNNIILQIISDLIFSILIGLLFLSCIQKYFYGELRLYICLIFAFGIYFQRKTLGKLFAKLELMLYNLGVRTTKRIKTTHFGRIIFK